VLKISLIVPCWNEEDNVEPFYHAVQKAFAGASYGWELLFIDDGSSDGTWKILERLYEKDPYQISVIRFSRNFGKEAAIFAGMKRADGDFAVVIDVDLQQRPELVIEMADFLADHQEYDVVAAYQQKRMERKTISGLKTVFYKLMNRICDIPFYPGASDFRMLRSYVAQAVSSVPEYFRFSKGIFSWVGYETYYMPYVAEERNAGNSKWSFWGLLKYAIEGIVSYTTFPLKISTYLGMAVSVCSVFYIVFILIEWIFFSIDIPGFVTTVVLILMFGGIQLLVLGIIGEYLGRTYIQGKHRPVFIEKEYLKSMDQKEDAVS